MYILELHNARRRTPWNSTLYFALLTVHISVGLCTSYLPHFFRGRAPRSYKTKSEISASAVPLSHSDWGERCISDEHEN